jgi:TusA-related sulfurtransferase
VNGVPPRAAAAGTAGTADTADTADTDCSDCVSAFAASPGAALAAGHPARSTPRPGVDIIVDACGLEPPEPFVLTMEGLDALPPGGRLLLLLPREPRPLYKVLAQNGYRWQSCATPQGIFEILIWAGD